MELHKLSTWLSNTKRSLNTKNQIASFSHQHWEEIQYTSKAEIYIDGNTIKHVECTHKLRNKNRRTPLLEDLHLQLINKIARNVGMLNKLKHFLSVYITKTIYSSLVVSHVQ